MTTLYSGRGNILYLGETAPDTAADSGFTPWDDVLHRGWHEGVPDNVLPAFFLIRENGYRWGECDVRISADGIPLLAHDETVTGMLDGVSTSYAVSETNAADITSLVIAKNERFGDIHPCTLEALLELAKTLDLGLVLDIKNSTATLKEANLKKLAAVVVGSGWAEHVIYMPGGGPNYAKHIQAIDRNASFDFVSAVKELDKLPDLTGYQALLTGANTVAFDFQAGVADEVVQAVHAAGLNVSFWGVSNTAHFRHNPLRVTYSGYGYAHLGRDYIRQKQAELAAKYATG